MTEFENRLEEFEEELKFIGLNLDLERSRQLMADATFVVRDPRHNILPDTNEESSFSSSSSSSFSMFESSTVWHLIYASAVLIASMGLCWCYYSTYRSDDDSDPLQRLTLRRLRQLPTTRAEALASPRDIDMQLADAIENHMSQLAALTGSLGRWRTDRSTRDSLGSRDSRDSPSHKGARETFRVRARTRRLRWDGDGRGHVSWTGPERFVRRRRVAQVCCSDDVNAEEESSSSKGRRPSKKKQKKKKKKKKNVRVYCEEDDVDDNEEEEEGKSCCRCSDEFRISRDSNHPLEFVSADYGIDDLSPMSEELRRALECAADMNFKERFVAFRSVMDSLRVHWTVGRVEFSVRRSCLLNDALDMIGDLPFEHWRRPFFISFEDECALDAGGLSREFFTFISVEAFCEGFGCFRDCHGSYQINDDSEADAIFGDARPWLAFVGRLMGKALLEGHHFTAHPCMILLKHMCGEPIELDDLQYVDFELWKNLVSLLTMPSDDLEKLETTFVVDKKKFDRKNNSSSIVIEELLENGANIVVTAENVDLYLKLRLKERVLDVCQRGLDAFLEGLYSVVPFEALLLLSARELELTLCGIPVVPVDDWRKSALYAGKFQDEGEKHPVVHFFWDVVASWDNEKRAKLLQWCTGSSKVPVQGFDSLQGRDGTTRRFTLTSLELSQAIYPRAHTCFNRIDLPLYKTKDDLKEALDFVLTNAIAHDVFSIE